MAEIRIETRPTFANYGHLYLVFRDDNGIETVIRGGPAGDIPLNFGNIITEAGVPIEFSEDARENQTPEDRFSTVINLGGRDANSVWEIMLQQAENINDANLDYNAFIEAQNSNSTITSVLDSVGIDISLNLPTGTDISWFPGINNPLDFATNLDGTSDDDTIRGGLGNDTITGSGGNDIINGGEGLDTLIYSGSSDDYQIELSPGGIARITDNNENRDGSDGLIGIEIIQFSDGSIDLRDGDVLSPPSPYANEAQDGFELAQQQGSPLVLDLDGDGIELTAVDSPTVYFDIDGDGFRESTGWVQPDDGLLVFDRNNDGYINDNSELFGNNDSFSNGFETLKALNTNGDNLINSADTDFAQLQVWRDLDSDGRSDVNELYSLNELNIKSIQLNYSNTNIANAGNQIKQVSSYELTDGTTREIVDAWFTFDQLNSYYDHTSTYNEPVVITEEILNLPNLKGYGDLPDLRIAMATDTELVNLVQDFSQKIVQGQFTQASELVEPILFHWAGVDTVDPNSRGNYVDARKLEFLEKFLGQSFRILGSDVANPLQAGGNTINQTLTSLSQAFWLRLVTQVTPISLELNSSSERLTIELDTHADRLIINDSFDINTALSKLESTLIDYQNSPEQLLSLEASFLVQLIREQSETYTNFAFGNSHSSYFVDLASHTVFGDINNNSLTGSDHKDILYGEAGDDTLQGGNNTDILYGGLGNDLLQGGDNNDTYIFEQGYGSDVISDYGIRRLAYLPDEIKSGGDNDTLIFGNGITRDNLTWNFDGQDLVFSLTDSPADQLTIQNFSNSFYQIENIGIAGNTLTLEEIITAQPWQDDAAINSLNWTVSAISFNGKDGNDSITTGDFNDTLFGGNGNDNITSNGGEDTLRGGAGDDVLKAGADDDKLWGEDGNDTLEGADGNDLLNGANGNDSILGGSGEDTLRGSAGSDTLKGGHGNDLYYGDGGDDLLSDSYNNNLFDSDTLDGGTGNDTLRGGGGNDTYIFDRGYGQDIISDYGTSKSAYQAPRTVAGGNSDTLIFGNGITHDNLSWNFDGKDLVFSLIDTPTDKITIENYYSSGYRIENIEVEGSLLTPEEIMTAEIWQDDAGIDSLNWSASAISFNGLAGNDTLTTGSFNDTLFGGNGNDSLTSNGGADSLFGGAGDDTLKAGDGNDLVNGDNNNDSIEGASGNDTLKGSAGNDTLKGGYGNDDYYGGSGDDLLVDAYATFDNDTLDGGTGNDTLNGGGNNDTYIFKKGYGQDVISDYGIRRLAYRADRIISGGNNDTLIFGNGITRSNLTWTFEGQDLVFSLSDSPTDRLTIQNYSNSFYDIENIFVEDNLLTPEEIASEA